MLEDLKRYFERLKGYYEQAESELERNDLTKRMTDCEAVIKALEKWE